MKERDRKLREYQGPGREILNHVKPVGNDEFILAVVQGVGELDWSQVMESWMIFYAS